jgi:hypothetical protein
VLIRVHPRLKNHACREAPPRIDFIALALPDVFGTQVLGQKPGNEFGAMILPYPRKGPKPGELYRCSRSERLHERLQKSTCIHLEVVAQSLDMSLTQLMKPCNSNMKRSAFLRVLCVSAVNACLFFSTLPDELRILYTVELGEFLKKDVHPVIMNTAGEELLGQIFSKGICLQVNDARSHALSRIAAYCRIADFDRYRKMAQRGFISRLKHEVRGG